MQPATVDQVASEAAFLSREQLQSLTRAANVLGKEVEEVLQLAMRQGQENPIDRAIRIL
jgi:hypothetical protein